MAERDVAVARERGAAEGDATLARELRAGSPDAARELCEKFGPRLFAFAAVRFPGDAELASDLAVQSLTDVARKIRWYNPQRSPFGAWVYGVARGQIRAELRRRRRRKSVPPHAVSPIEELAGVAQGHDMAGEIARRLDAQRQVAVLCAVLSEVEFEVLVLSAIDRLSAREIGMAVGRSERAVHSLLHRARTKARERLLDDDQ